MKVGGGNFRMGIGKTWNDLPLETWFLEVEANIGSRNFTSPFVMYASLMGRDAEIREEHERNIFPLGGDTKDRDLGNAPLVIEGVGGTQGEIGPIHPTSATTNTCGYRK